MTKDDKELLDGILVLPSFPVVLVTAEANIMTAAAFHFYSFEPPCVMVGVIPENLTYELIREKGEFGINILTTDQMEIADICGSISGRSEDKYKKAGLTPFKGQVIEGFLDRRMSGESGMPGCARSRLQGLTPVVYRRNQSRAYRLRLHT